jgi:hypothetical protein
MYRLSLFPGSIISGRVLFRDGLRVAWCILVIGSVWLGPICNCLAVEVLSAKALFDALQSQQRECYRIQLVLKNTFETFFDTASKQHRETQLFLDGNAGQVLHAEGSEKKGALRLNLLKDPVNRDSWSNAVSGGRTLWIYDCDRNRYVETFKARKTGIGVPFVGHWNVHPNASSTREPGGFLFPFLKTGRIYPHTGAMLITPLDVILSTDPDAWEVKGITERDGRKIEEVYISESSWYELKASRHSGKLEAQAFWKVFFHLSPDEKPVVESITKHGRCRFQDRIAEFEGPTFTSLRLSEYKDFGEGLLLPTVGSYELFSAVEGTGLSDADLIIDNFGDDGVIHNDLKVKVVNRTSWEVLFASKIPPGKVMIFDPPNRVLSRDLSNDHKIIIGMSQKKSDMLLGKDRKTDTPKLPD